jgi:hypothetical protein
MSLLQKSSKPRATISLDLDNEWSYLKTHGTPDWEKLPSYLETFTPIVLDFLDRLDLKITFFIVGQDAALEKNQAFLKELTENGHEVGNHSFHHDVWLNLHPKPIMKEEVLKTEDCIQQATGQKPIGFRGPGFVYSKSLLEVLAECNYRYDATILPTFIGPLARAYFFKKSELSKEEKANRGKIFSSFKEGFRSSKPFLWDLSKGNSLLEIPVTTLPFLKTPFHLSYLLYLSCYSQILMFFYLRLAIFMCKLTQTGPSFLLHPPDLMGPEDSPDLSFFPGMNIAADRKRELSGKAIAYIKKHFHLVPMNAYAEEICASESFKMVKPEDA